MCGLASSQTPCLLTTSLDREDSIHRISFDNNGGFSEICIFFYWISPNIYWYKTYYEIQFTRSYFSQQSCSYLWVPSLLASLKCIHRLRITSTMTETKPEKKTANCAHLSMGDHRGVQKLKMGLSSSYRS